MKVSKEVYSESYLSDWIKAYPGCRRILDGSFIDPEYLSDVAHTKRFLERYTADPAFRADVAVDPGKAVEKYGLKADPEAIRPIWDHDHAVEHAKHHGKATPLSVQRYRTFIREKRVHRERLRLQECIPCHPLFRVWRERQLNRCWTHLGPSRAVAVVQTPLAFELSKGCSVGCWFCGFAAKGKESDIEYTRDNAELWRGVLGVLKRIIGPAASTGVCYWATDPLDNPDYEKFCSDFATVLGRFPQTTTAQPQQHIERVRALLKLSRSMGGIIDRFSILNLKMLDKVHSSFTAEELLFTELITQNMESTSMLSRSGRARGSKSLYKKAANVRGTVDHKAPGTIACLSGYLINMVDRSVKLITPSPCNDRWPDGYWILEEGRFNSVEDFEKLALDMIDRHMFSTLRARDPIRFRADLKYLPEEEGFSLKSYFTNTTVKGFPCATRVGELIASGTRSAGDIAVEIEDEEGVDAATTFNTLNELFERGFIDEEPEILSERRSS